MGFLSAFSKSRRSLPHQPLPSALFPLTDRTMSVTAWMSSIRDMTESQACRLGRIVHCKVKSGPRDEFLLVHVYHPSGKETLVYVGRDASFDDPSGEEQNPSRTDVRAISIPPSRDHVRLSSDGSEASLTRHIAAGWAKVHTVAFSKRSEAPSVAHLAVLLTVVGRHAAVLGASVEMRSGWFAYCVAEVMRETFLGKAKANGTWVRVQYGGMKVEERDTVDALVREFRPAWDEFSRRQTTTERGTSKRREEKDPFVDMLRAMDL